MWRSPKNLIGNCFRFIFRCRQRNLDIDDLEDIPEYEEQDVPVHFQPRSFGGQLPARQRHAHLQHRPDAPCFRRRSPPEIVSKIRQALEEMSADKPVVLARGDEVFQPIEESVSSNSMEDIWQMDSDIPGLA